MNIGIVTTWFERGAAYVSRQYRQALEPHHRVFIYARGGEQRARGNPVWDAERVTWGGRQVVPVPTAINLPHFERWIRDNALDIVLFNEQRWWPPVMLCARLGVITAAYIDYYTELSIPAFAAFSNMVVPIMIGARDMAFPTLNAFAFWRLRLAPELPLRALGNRYGTLRTALVRDGQRRDGHLLSFRRLRPHAQTHRPAFAGVRQAGPPRPAGHTYPGPPGPGNSRQHGAGRAAGSDK